MKVRVTSVLDASIEKVWAEVQKPSLLQEIAWPLAKVVSSDPRGFPRQWLERSTYRCRSYLFGFLPTGERELHIERIDSQRHEIQSREKDAICRVWDHLI